MSNRKYRHDLDHEYQQHRRHRDDVESPIGVILVLLGGIAIFAFFPGLNKWPGKSAPSSPPAQVETMPVPETATPTNNPFASEQ